MKLPVSIQPEAIAEFNDAFDWYEDRRPGHGVVFAGQIQEAIDRIAEMPEAYEIVLDDIHRAVVHRFPYSIYFRVGAQQIVVLAIFHGKRDPLIWQSRV